MALVPANFAWIGVSVEDLADYVSPFVTITSAVPLPTLTLTYEDTIAGLKETLIEYMAARGWRII